LSSNACYAELSTLGLHKMAGHSMDFHFDNRKKAFNDCFAVKQQVELLATGRS
jgi:hypothetical protein